MAADAELGIAEIDPPLLSGYPLLQALVGIRLRSVGDSESRRHLTWLSDIVAAMGLISRRVVEGGSVDFAAGGPARLAACASTCAPPRPPCRKATPCPWPSSCTS